MGATENSVQFGHFSEVDETKKADQFIKFLDWIENTPQNVLVRQRSYELLQPAPGLRVLDAGCGAGRAVSEMQGLGMQVVGVDSSDEIIGVARKRFPACDFRVSCADTLPLESGSLDRYRAERLYQHLLTPMTALMEAYRVLAPGSRLVVMDPDWDMLAVDADNRELTRRIVRGHADSITNPWMGRQLSGLLMEAGFKEVAVEVKTAVGSKVETLRNFFPSVVQAAVEAGTISQVEADAWLAEQELRVQAGRFLYILTIFLVSANRP